MCRLILQMSKEASCFPYSVKVTDISYPLSAGGQGEAEGSWGGEGVTLLQMQQLLQAGEWEAVHYSLGLWVGMGRSALGLNHSPNDHFFPTMSHKCWGRQVGIVQQEISRPQRSARSICCFLHPLAGPVSPRVQVLSLCTLFTGF